MLRGEDLFQESGLLHGTRITVENKTFAAVRTNKSRLDDAVNNVITDQAAGIHLRGDETSQTRTARSRFPEHVSCGNLGD